MRRIVGLASSLVLAATALTAVGAPATAHPGRGPVTTWHRVNTDQSNPAPQHERFRCRERRGQWTCLYDQVPEPRLNFDEADTEDARFTGRDMTASWTCPTWFPAEVCLGVTRVVRGEILFVVDGTEFLIQEELVFTGAKKDRKMYITFVDFGFSCPWYPTFRKALAANPFPLPFNGTDWPADDCLAAPSTT